MKVSLILFIAILCCQVSFAKVTKFRSTTYTYRNLQGGQWSNWAPSTPKTDLIITFDEPKQRITFFGNDAHNYDILKIYPGKVENGYDTYAFDCVADNGKKCTIKWFQSTSDKNSLQVNIAWPEKIWNYHVKSLD